MSIWADQKIKELLERMEALEERIKALEEPKPIQRQTLSLPEKRAHGPRG